MTKIQMPEPDSYLFQHEETGLIQYVDSQQVEWGFEKNNPRWQRIGGMITTDQAEAYANARVEKVLEELRKLSEGAYCLYIDTLYRDECLGWEAKVKDGRFGEREFNAHKKAHEFLGQHRAFAEASITICALIPKEQQK